MSFELKNMSKEENMTAEELQRYFEQLCQLDEAVLRELFENSEIYAKLKKLSEQYNDAQVLKVKATNFDRIKEKILQMNVDELIEYCGGSTCENILCVEIGEKDGECYGNGPKYRPDHTCERCIKNYLLSKE